jgi:hypothetical protein
MSFNEGAFQWERTPMRDVQTVTRQRPNMHYGALTVIRRDTQELTIDMYTMWPSLQYIDFEAFT